MNSIQCNIISLNNSLQKNNNNEKTVQVNNDSTRQLAIVDHPPIQVPQVDIVNREVDFSNTDKDVIFQIFKHAYLWDGANLRATCRKFRDITDDLFRGMSNDSTISAALFRIAGSATRGLDFLFWSMQNNIFSPREFAGLLIECHALNKIKKHSVIGYLSDKDSGFSAYAGLISKAEYNANQFRTGAAAFKNNVAPFTKGFLTVFCSLAILLECTSLKLDVGASIEQQSNHMISFLFTLMAVVICVLSFNAEITPLKKGLYFGSVCFMLFYYSSLILNVFHRS